MCDSINDMSLPVLPVSPTFLSISKDEEGLFGSTSIREFLAVMSSDLKFHSKLPLFQLVPETFEIGCEYDGESSKEWITEVPIDHNVFFDSISVGKKVLRIDADAFFTGNPCCKKFQGQRNEESGKLCNCLCKEYDSRILLLFHRRLSKISYDKERDRYSTVLQELIDEFNNNKDKRFWVRIGTRNTYRVYIQYTCGISGLEEYAFPIFHNGHIVAVIMIGQRIPDCNNRERYALMLERVKVLPDGLKSEDFSYLSGEVLSKVFKRIENLEKRIDAKVHQKALNTITMRMQEIEKRFKEELSCMDEKSVVSDNSVGALYVECKRIDEGMIAYKHALKKALDLLCRSFNPEGSVIVYARKQLPDNNGVLQSFELIEASSSAVNPVREIQFAPSIKLSGADDDTIFNNAIPTVKQITEYDHMKVFSGFLNGFTILVRECFDDSFREYSHQYDILQNRIDSLYRVLLEPYNVLRAARLSKNLEITMRVTVHETSNILPLIQRTIHEELRFGDKEKRYIDYPSEIPDDHSRALWDVYQRTKLLDGIYKRSTAVFKTFPVNLDYHDLHRLIYSTKTMFDDKAAADKAIKITVEMHSSYNSYYLYTDKNLFDQILFNLVDNAVKYGYRGSNIFISVSGASNNNLNLSVTSYGKEIDKSVQNHIYELFYRSNYDSEVEGMGVGLYLVKKMCDALEYKIIVSSDHLSDVNVPVAYLYARRNHLPDSRLDSSINEILSSNYSDEEIESVNDNSDWSPGKWVLSSLVDSKTFKNTFTVKIEYFKEKTLLKKVNNG